MHHGVIFNFGSAKMHSPATFETSFSDKKIYALLQLMYFYIIVLFPLTAILQLINFTKS